VPVFRGGGFLGGQFTRDVAGNRPVEVRPADLELGLDVGEREAGVLEFDCPSSEHLAQLAA
jgi:hypothetical protein